MRLRVSQPAEQDLEEIFLYWAERVSIPVADRVIEDIVNRIQLLGEHPQAGKAVDHIAEDVRCFPAGKYMIYYRTKGPFTDILHIFHGAREQKRAFETLKR